MTIPIRKKLIEVALPLEAINAEAQRRTQKAPKGYPTSIHKYWAQRPIAACRAVIFAQLVDDPSACPLEFKNPEEQSEERVRLHRLIERMCKWDASETDLADARYEIARTIARARQEDCPRKAADVFKYLQEHAPPIYDPFCGGGSIPLEAQRLGLRAYGSDLNPVAVLISKCLTEIPPKFAGKAPINASTREKKELIGRSWTGARGLAEDVRYYGAWIREQAERQIGNLFPKVTLADGSRATAVAWIWARTVRSPDPLARGALVPLASTFVLSTKEGKRSWVEPIVDIPAATYRFEVKSGTPTKEEEKRAKNGTKSSRGSNFTCLLSGAPIDSDWVKAEGKAGRLGTRLMAIVVDIDGRRGYVAPTPEHEQIAATANPVWAPSEPLPDDPRNFWTVTYGVDTYGKLFTPRQLAGLSAFSELIGQARDQAFSDAISAGFPDDSTALDNGGIGARAYSDAIATYLAFALDRLAFYNSMACRWLPKDNAMGQSMGRQAIEMKWDFAEGNPFGKSSSAISKCVDVVAACLDTAFASGTGNITHVDAPKNNYPVRPVVISTDPPYYDNIAYADLSDFFYVWLRHSLADRGEGDGVWPELFRRLVVPKAEELVATPYRHGGKDEAEAFFMDGMGKALSAIHDAAISEYPLAIYYAFKQSEAAQDGLTSAGWASFLQAVVNSGLSIDGTWPLRIESEGRQTGQNANALASAIVLVCRKNEVATRSIERDEFKRTLRRELPEAYAQIRAAGVGPVDMAQAAIGPGMGIFTRFDSVLESSGEAMLVRDALKLINEVRDEIEDEGDYDLETRFAVEWFSEAQWDAKESGRAILLANAKNLAESQLERAGVIEAKSGKTRLRTRAEIGANYDPADDKTPTVWEHAQALAHALEQGGQERAATLFAKLRDTESVRALAYRLYGICERKGWSAEALIWNRLAEEWRRIEDLAASAPKESAAAPDLFGDRP